MGWKPGLTSIGHMRIERLHLTLCHSESSVTQAFPKGSFAVDLCVESSEPLGLSLDLVFHLETVPWTWPSANLKEASRGNWFLLSLLGPQEINIRLTSVSKAERLETNSVQLAQVAALHPLHSIVDGNPRPGSNKSYRQPRHHP
jgi:hypothetical protein